VIATLIEEPTQLLQLNASQAKAALANVPKATAVKYLAELFRGNGWTVSFTEGNEQAILLSDPNSPQTILLLVKFIIQQHELTHQQAREELLDFENNLSLKYGCSQFAIIVLNGISAKAEILEQFNLLLHDWSYVEELIKAYRTSRVKEPRITLFAHNKQTYKKVCTLMRRTKTIAIVQATGTGKSFLIAKLLQDFTGQRRLVMAPSTYIIEQVKEHIRWDAGNIEFMTYARSMNLSESEVKALQPAAIVLDEFHRCGAEEWGRGVQNILHAYPDAFKFGTSATPIRYMDNGRDMSKELFGNNVAENLSLAQAIVRNILPMPKYVCALYSLREEIDELKEKINKSRVAEVNKRRMLVELDAVSINWELSNGVPAVLKKHLRKHMRKFIVFCSDEAHLVEMEPTVTSWFSQATNNAPIQCYRIHNSEPASFDNLEAFKMADSSKAIHLLLSINMLNEGLHVNEVSGVVLLRPTESPNIFYQQIGRCLKVGGNHAPVIFDLVNNFRSIHTGNFMYDLEFARSEYAIERRNEELKDNSPVFTLMDEVREITEVFGEIKFRIDDWDAMFERLVDYKKQFGTCDVTAIREDTENRPLWNWLHLQRTKYKKGLLEPDRVEKLSALGVVWKLDQLKGPREEGWEKHFKNLNAFREKYGHCNVADGHQEYQGLANFVSDNRYRYGLGVLEEHRINKLVSIGFEFDRQKNFREGRWQLRFDELVEYKNIHGHLKGAGVKSKGLGHWIFLQRTNFRNNKLDAGRQQKLNSIGFEWTDDRETIFEKNLSKMISLFHQQGHFTFPVNTHLNNFSRGLRESYRDKTLPLHVIERLQPLGYHFEMKTPHSRVKDTRLQQLAEFFKANGHGNVTVSNENYEGLGAWFLGQRKNYKNGTLDKDLMKKFEELGIDWEKKQNDLDGLWSNQYAKLRSMYEEDGNFTTARLRENKQLNSWSSSQRQKFKKGKLTNDQVDKLNAIGFIWDVFDFSFEENFAKLVNFKEKHGHCRAPQHNEETRTLSAWCYNVRRSRSNGTVSPEKIKRLESIGFLWNIVDSLWYEKYDTLKIYLHKNSWAGLNTKNKSLFGWITQQRKDYKKGRLSAERIMLLNMLGIDWTPMENNWHRMFEEYMEFREKYNMPVVPSADKSFKRLWSWCVTQRANYRNKKLTQAQLQMLNDAGFLWEARKNSPPGE
jgi:superfamily II DNA or RNA helicase